MAVTIMVKSARILLISFLALMSVGGVRMVYKNNSQNISLRPLMLDPAHPGVRRVGDLIFLAAWELSGNHSDFGGISALAALPDRRFIGVSDAGTLIGFGLTGNDHADRSFIAPLPGTQGPHSNFRDRDSEGIAYDPDSGQFWVSFEAKHAIRRYSTSFSRSTGELKLQGTELWANNKGVEALMRLRSGRFIAIAENLESGRHDGLFFSSDPVEPGTALSHFYYRPPTGYRVTDGAALPDGRVLILNRSIGFPEGFSAKLAIIDPKDIRSGETAMGKVIATLAAPLLIDNMEGIAVTRDGADDIVWLISDNNFNILQRTLLMKFRLSEPPNNKKPEAVIAPGFDSL